MRKKVLDLYARIQAITTGYDGVEAYEGESFCEDEFGMVRTDRGTKDVEGHVGEISVQTKFKWPLLKTSRPSMFRGLYTLVRILTSMLNRCIVACCGRCYPTTAERP